MKSNNYDHLHFLDRILTASLSAYIDLFSSISYEFAIWLISLFGVATFKFVI